MQFQSIAGAEATTDANGLASFKAPLPTIGKGGDRSYYLTVSGGGHFGFASTRWQQGANPYQLNLPTEYYAREWVGQLFTDRPIYRPGEKVAVKVNFNCSLRRADPAQGLYNTPQLTLALLRQLVKQAGVRESDIVVYDASRFVSDAAITGPLAAFLEERGARLDAAPDLLFTLRGVDRTELIAAAGADLPMTRNGGARERILADDAPRHIAHSVG